MKEHNSSFEVITTSCPRALPGTGLLLLGELSAFPEIQQQCWNKALSLFTVLSPCLKSILLIVWSLQLVK